MLGDWVIKSSHGKQTFLSVLIILTGFVLAIAFRDFDSSTFSNSLAGFLLGILLIFIGTPALVLTGREIITVDIKAAQIRIDFKNSFKEKKKVIPFGDIVGMHISHLGKYSSGVVTYYISLQLQSGKTQPLFFPAYYEGRWNRASVEDKLARLEEIIMLGNKKV
jgi:prepilin signal peptidase PulO-like enzyme (type II secretory pathway)